MADDGSGGVDTDSDDDLFASYDVQQSESDQDVDAAEELEPESDEQPPMIEYEVESILDKDNDAKKGVLYLVKWKGFDKEGDNTWEPEANLQATAATFLRRFNADTRQRQEGESANLGAGGGILVGPTVFIFLR